VIIVIKLSTLILNYGTVNYAISTYDSYLIINTKINVNNPTIILIIMIKIITYLQIEFPKILLTWFLNISKITFNNCYKMSKVKS
jgi:hypothetical protein